MKGHWTIAALVAVGLATGLPRARAVDISWQGTSALTSNEGGHYTAEGTAIFMTGEEAHLAVKAAAGANSSLQNGTSAGEIVYRFKDGSGFTLHFVSIWNEAVQRNAGIFGDGIGNFAGMTGSAAGVGPAPAKGPSHVVWVGAYDMPPPK